MGPSIQIGHESGVELTWDYGWDVTFRDGKIIRVGFFQEETRAFGAEI
jgi:ketosteroid isomerase-like protein